MERRQHAMAFYGTEPEISPDPGIEVVDDPADKYYVAGKCHQKRPISETLSPGNGICGLSKAIFLLAVALSALAIGVIGLGAGLGVALNKVRTTDGYNIAPTESASETPITSPPSSTSTLASSSASDSASASTPSSSTANNAHSTSTSSTSPKPSNICPNANNTIVTSSPGEVRYRVACESDFSGSGKQTLASFLTTTWDDCLGLCNNMNFYQGRADIGCTWNVEGTRQQTPGTCWCLGGADKTVVSEEGNVVGIPL